MGDFTGSRVNEGGSDPASSASSVRHQLLRRRSRLAALPGANRRVEFRHLLNEVDSALERLARGDLGLCETCHDPIEPESLVEDPTTRVCLDCLNDSQQRALEHDLELAASIQRALLPDEQVDVSGWEIAHRYRPLGAVSGDYCDVIRPESADSATGFVLGDVSGKGVAASILMAHLQAVFRSLASLGLPLADLAQRANRILCDGTVSSSYSTLLLGRLLPGGSLELCNAGHCPPLLVQNGAVTALPATGMPLGLFPGSTFSTTRLQLAKGDALFLFSDGLSEATNDVGEAYGPGRVEEVARGLNGEPTGKALERFLNDLDRHRNGAAMDDDLTVMMIRRMA